MVRLPSNYGRHLRHRTHRHPHRRPRPRRDPHDPHGRPGPHRHRTRPRRRRHQADRELTPVGNSSTAGSSPRKTVGRHRYFRLAGDHVGSSASNSFMVLAYKTGAPRGTPAPPTPPCERPAPATITSPATSACSSMTVFASRASCAPADGANSRSPTRARSSAAIRHRPGRTRRLTPPALPSLPRLERAPSPPRRRTRRRDPRALVLARLGEAREGQPRRNLLRSGGAGAATELPLPRERRCASGVARMRRAGGTARYVPVVASMTLERQLLLLFLLPIPIACVAWTVTHGGSFREVRDWCTARSRNSRSLFVRKFFYLFTCEYCQPLRHGVLPRHHGLSAPVRRLAEPVVSLAGVDCKHLHELLRSRAA